MSALSFTHSIAENFRHCKTESGSGNERKIVIEHYWRCCTVDDQSVVLKNNHVVCQICKHSSHKRERGDVSFICKLPIYMSLQR